MTDKKEEIKEITNEELQVSEQTVSEQGGDTESPAEVAASVENATSSTENVADEEVEKVRNKRKLRIGIVTSDKMDKTAVVTIEALRKHKLYPKTVKRTKKFKVHDEKNECNVGDRVRIMETKPISKDKRWRLTEIIERAK